MSEEWRFIGGLLARAGLERAQETGVAAFKKKNLDECQGFFFFYYILTYRQIFGIITLLRSILTGGRK